MKSAAFPVNTLRPCCSLSAPSPGSPPRRWGNPEDGVRRGKNCGHSKSAQRLTHGTEGCKFPFPAIQRLDENSEAAWKRLEAHGKGERVQFQSLIPALRTPASQPPTFNVRYRVVPRRLTRNRMVSPDLYLAILRSNSSRSRTDCWSTSKMMSPGRSPAAAAGESLST